MVATTETRRYRFAPLDRSGWLLGLGAAQCVALGGGLAASALVLSVGVAPALAPTPFVGALVFSFARWRGRPLHEWAPIATWWAALRITGRTRWTAQVPLLGVGDRGRPLPLPPCLDGLEVVAASSGWTQRARLGPVGVLRDGPAHTFTAALRVQGREFALVERAEQERLLAGWGAALAAFCRERGKVSRVGWCEWAAPAGLEEHLAYVDAEATAPADSPHRAAYLDLLGTAGPMTTRHEVLVTVTVDARRCREARRPGDNPEERFVDALLDELHLLTSRLEDAGLVVDPPLSPAQLREVLRLRLDPSAAGRLTTRRRALPFGEAVVGDHNFGPLALDAHFQRVQIDGSWHRTYLIAEWPRLEMPPAWMEPLLLFAGGIRTVSVVCEPIAPSRSQRHIDRDATKLASDEEQRTKRGFRIRARDRRSQAAVLEREAEIVSGYAELEYSGFVTVTGADADQLARSCAEYEQAAAQAGLELRALDGQHDLAIATALPIARHPAPPRVAL